MCKVFLHLGETGGFYAVVKFSGTNVKHLADVSSIERHLRAVDIGEGAEVPAADAIGRRRQTRYLQVFLLKQWLPLCAGKVHSGREQGNWAPCQAVRARPPREPAVSVW